MKLGKYKGLEVKGPDLHISDWELNRSITNMQRKNALFYHIDERPAQMGDVVVINYKGFVDGKPFLGGKATHHRIVLGEEKFLPGFEEQIIGRTMGDHFDIETVFPADHANRKLAGKDVCYQTELLFVGREETPAFDDDFALDFSTFATAEELKESLLAGLRAKRESSEDERIQEELLTQVIEGAEIYVNEEVIGEFAKDVLQEQIEEIEANGMTLEGFLKCTHQTMEDLRDQCHKKARRNFQETVALHAIAMEEGLEISEEEINETVWKMAFYEDIDPVEMLESMEDAELTGIKLQIYCDKAMDLVRETAILI